MKRTVLFLLSFSFVSLLLFQGCATKPRAPSDDFMDAAMKVGDQLTAYPTTTTNDLTDMVNVLDEPSGTWSLKKTEIGNLFHTNSSGDSALAFQNDGSGTLNLTVEGTVTSNASGTSSLTLGSDSATIKLGADEEVVLTHSHNTGVLMALDYALLFGDTAVYIESDDDGYLDLDADTGIRLNGDTVVNTANSLAIPQGGSPTVNAAGEIAVDTTDDQLIYYGGAARVIPYKHRQCFTLEDPADADDNVPIFSLDDGFTVVDMRCWTEGGTSAVITLSDGSNDLDSMTCDADGTNDDGSIANATFTADEQMEFDTGTVTGSVDWVNFCFSYTITAE